VPPKRCAVVASAWLNFSNSFPCCSAVVPMPVSETANSTKLLPLLTLRATSLTSPALVNLQALLNRLSRICRSRMGSTVNAPRFQLSLKRPSISRPSGEWNDGNYDVLADGVVVGRIMKAARRAPCGK